MKKVVFLVLIILKGVCGFCQPNLQCNNFNAYGIQHCIAGIQSAFLNVVSKKQNESEWCWAASISTVFAYYGHSVSQERVVKETFGQIENLPGDPNQILQALNRVWIDDNGTSFNVSANSLSANQITAIQDLISGNPLIIGSHGHAMVLTAIEYDHDIFNKVAVTNSIVRHPWPNNNSPRSLTISECSQYSFLARIRVY
jgi:hypothetical protein